MATVGFIGLGNMGGPMARNLVKAGHQVKGFDVVGAAIDRAAEGGVARAASAAEAASDVETVITMLPEGRHVRDAYVGGGSILAHAHAGALLIDSSTIDVESARAVAAEAERKGFDMVDAPVSGGVAGATAGTLTFMVGGAPKTFTRAKLILSAMGRNIVHAGGPGNGQAAKMCNNMILGISMIAVCEAFALAEKVGLEAQKLFEVSSTASGQCWSLTTYCPVPGPVPASPANRGYQAGFTAAMMLKDLKLAQAASTSTGAATALGAHAAELYQRYCDAGGAPLDFSGIMRMVADASRRA
jgi:3-hydroxyisobutyrate dehydrogenase